MSNDLKKAIMNRKPSSETKESQEIAKVSPRSEIQGIEILYLNDDEPKSQNLECSESIERSAAQQTRNIIEQRRCDSPTI